MNRKIFNDYLLALDQLFVDGSKAPRAFTSNLEIATNGQAKQQLIHSVPLAERRKNGIFFTDTHIARQAAKHVEKELALGAKVLDPTCGAGDLLIACAELMPHRASLKLTLHQWENRLFGIDRYPEFIEASRRRLLLKCLLDTQKKSLGIDSSNCFPGLKHGNALAKSNTAVIGNVDVIIANPPFHMMQTPRDVRWASGAVNAAAVYTDKFVSGMKAGAKLVSILPDVLRSGSRYRLWRNDLHARLRVTNLDLLEEFDEKTDVHVFILVGEKREVQDHRDVPFFRSRCNPSSIGDYFDVSVGPVVDYRSPKIGRWLPYLIARDLPTGDIVYSAPKMRRFSGRRCKAPFILLRRTSRPNAKKRLHATIVAGVSEYAIENHLLVLTPRDGTLKSCREAIGVLESDPTTAFLNDSIRCRHLTVGVVQSIPWLSSLRIAG